MEYNKDNPLKVVTLCSGYDSQCLALERLKTVYPKFDYELVAWSEFDPESKTPLDKQLAVVAHNALFPQWADRNLGDMTKIDWTQVEDFDLLFYSTPCQSVSQAGLQHGFTEGSGTRSSIIWNVRDAVKIKRPKFLCLENVKAMVSGKFIGMSKINDFLSEEARNSDVARYSANDVKEAYIEGATETLDELKTVLSVSEDKYLRENINKMINYLEGKE